MAPRFLPRSPRCERPRRYCRPGVLSVNPARRNASAIASPLTDPGMARARTRLGRQNPAVAPGPFADSKLRSGVKNARPKIQEPEFRIRLPPAASLRTLVPSRVGAMHRRLVYLRRENHRVPPARCRRCATGNRSPIVAHAGSACRFFVRGERSARTGDHPRKQSAAFEAAWPRGCPRLRGRVLRWLPSRCPCVVREESRER